MIKDQKNMERKNLFKFNKNGYLVVRALSKKNIYHFKKKILYKLQKVSKNYNISNRFDRLDEMGNYHKISINDEQHKLLMGSKFRYLDLNNKEVKLFENDICDSIFEYFYGSEPPIIKHPKNNILKKNIIGFRVVRPNEKTVAGFHSESSYGIHCFTLWIPLTGTGPKYSLKVLPGSHLYRHKENTIIKNKKISSAKIYKKNYIKKLGIFKRPNLKLGEGIFFHPDLIHGNSANLGSKTRVSLEMRFYRKEYVSALPKRRGIKRN